MKAIIRLLAVMTTCLLTTTLLTAQMNVGLRGGIGLYKWHYDMPAGSEADWSDFQKSLLTPYLAVPLEIKIADFFAIQPELTYQQRGTREKIDTTLYYGLVRIEHQFDDRWRLNYLTVPVLAKFMYDTEALEIFAIAGPEVAYAVSGKVKKKEIRENGIREELEFDNSIEFENLGRFDFGLVFGGGVALKLGPGKALFDARYNLGLNNIKTREDSDLKMYNRGFGLSAGYMVPLGR